MKIGIVAAMQEELDSLLKLMPEYEETAHRVFKYYSGSLYGIDAVLLLCGIGRVNATVGTALLIEKYKPDYIINTGVGGGFSTDRLRIGDIVVSSEVRHHDVDATIFDYEYGQVPQMPAAYYPDEKLKNMVCSLTPLEGNVQVFEGQILSGDIFVHQEEQIQQIRERFPSAMVAEMEGAAIAQTCYLFDTPFLIIRSISDLVDADQSHEVYKQSLEKTAENSVSLILKLLHKLKDNDYMKRIESFSVDHTKLKRGLYVSRTDAVGDSYITTFDIRMKAPNMEPVLDVPALHTIEHIGATFLRNHTEWAPKTIYFGPMGCRTGCYVLFKGNLKSSDIVELMKEMFTFIAGFEGDIPGAEAKECGNYLNQDLPMAKYEAGKFLTEVLNVITSETLNYPES